MGCRLAPMVLWDFAGGRRVSWTLPTWTGSRLMVEHHTPTRPETGMQGSHVPRVIPSQWILQGASSHDTHWPCWTTFLHSFHTEFRWSLEQPSSCAWTTIFLCSLTHPFDHHLTWPWPCLLDCMNLITIFSYSDCLVDSLAMLAFHFLSICSACWKPWPFGSANSCSIIKSLTFLTLKDGLERPH